MPKKTKKEFKSPPYPICPGCGSTDFLIDGYVGHVQPYDAKTGGYSVSKMNWEDDIPTGARCASCDKDSTALLKKFDVLAFYKVELRER